MQYQVFVEENSHYMDESYRRSIGWFNSLDEAVQACKGIVNSNLLEAYKPGMSSEELLVQYALYGEDPFIVSEEGGVPFSARDYAHERVTEICKKR